MRTTRHLARIPLALLLVALAGAGCSGDDDDSSAKDAKTTTTAEGDRSSGGGSSTTDDTAALSPEDARDEGNPETYARIEAETDCTELQKEVDAAESNAAKYEDEDPRRQSILLSYADAARERMDELDCPAS